MSDKPSEYLKRTCLICGCHTNQTINIYEPRSGPNIVQLIQAKFKFQPLNEDKYLCFSCNNWLINWHSLQALNSNDGESPSGTFRPHMNGVVHEDGAKPPQQKQLQLQQQQQPQHKPNVRPIAQVRPWQLAETAMRVEDCLEPKKPTHCHAQIATHTTTTTNLASTQPRTRPLRYCKRNFRLQPTRWRRCVPHKAVQTCWTCGRSIVVRMRATLNAATLRRAQQRKCRKCCEWRNQLKRLAKAMRLEQQKLQSSEHKLQHLVSTVAISGSSSNSSSCQVTSNQQNNQSQQQQQPHHLQRPLVDGKVVAMLRRLGTTLSRENANGGSNTTAAAAAATTTTTSSATLPPIMSPAKPKPRWTRQLDEDEILLDFNTAISEVLPKAVAAQLCGGEGVLPEEVPAVVRQTRRKLSYQMSANDGAEVAVECQQQPPIPKGLSVTLI